jgi:hypothetical protein
MLTDFMFFFAPFPKPICGFKNPFGYSRFSLRLTFCQSLRLTVLIVLM